MCLFFWNAATVWVKVRSEGCAWICSQPFDPPQTEAWMTDRWGVIIGKTATIMPIKQCLLLLPVPFLSVYQTMTIMQKAGHRRAASAHLFVLFLSFYCDFVILKCICLRRNLLLLLAAAAGELAAGSSGLVGTHHCSDFDVLRRTSGSIRLSLTLVQVSALLGWTCSGIDQGSRKTVMEWQFSPQGNSLAK